MDNNYNNSLLLERNLIIICGVGRSGTSLLQSMLNAHSQVCFSPETHFLRKYILDYNKRKQLERNGVGNFIKVLNGDSDYLRLKIDAHDFLTNYREAGKKFDLIKVYEDLMAVYAQEQSKKRYGDKDPRLVEDLIRLHAVQPDAIVIHLIRDPRDVLLSRMKADWSSGRPYWVHILLYRVQLQLGRKSGRLKYGDRYKEVYYEKLISDPVNTLVEICNHINVKFEKKMMSFSESANRLVSSDEMQWKKETLGPLLPDNKEKWRSELSPWKIRLTESICSFVFEGGEYKRATGLYKLNIISRIFLFVMPAVGKIAEIAYSILKK